MYRAQLVAQSDYVVVLIAFAVSVPRVPTGVEIRIIYVLDTNTFSGEASGEEGALVVSRADSFHTYIVGAIGSQTFDFVCGLLYVTSKLPIKSFSGILENTQSA